MRSASVMIFLGHQVLLFSGFWGEREADELGITAEDGQGIADVMEHERGNLPSADSRSAFTSSACVSRQFPLAVSRFRFFSRSPPQSSRCSAAPWRTLIFIAWTGR